MLWKHIMIVRSYDEGKIDYCSRNVLLVLALLFLRMSRYVNMSMGVHVYAMSDEPYDIPARVTDLECACQSRCQVAWLYDAEGTLAFVISARVHT